jgi:hypothetical protein
MTFLAILVLLICGQELLKIFKSCPPQKTILEDAGKSQLPKEKTVEEIYAKEIEESLKPGYMDDPEWITISKRVRATREQNLQKERMSNR